MNCSTGDWACELSRIADAMNGFDWNSFAATLLATLVGAGVAAAVSFWLAERDRPRPMWKANATIESDNLHDGRHSVEVVVTNIGDGAAYHPRITALGDNLTGRRRADAALLEPGETLKTWISVPGTGEFGTDPETLGVIDTREVDWSRGVTMQIEWHQPPRRSHTKRTRVKLDPPTT
jgi:hypothetical protein